MSLNRARLRFASRTCSLCMFDFSYYVHNFHLASDSTNDPTSFEYPRGSILYIGIGTRAPTPRAAATYCTAFLPLPLPRAVDSTQSAAPLAPAGHMGARAGSETKLRLALVGCGRIAQVHWAGIEESATHLIHVVACAFSPSLQITHNCTHMHLWFASTDDGLGSVDLV
jgi:hypothetical protein